jgi:hypothetical protein
MAGPPDAMVFPAEEFANLMALAFRMMSHSLLLFVSIGTRAEAGVNPKVVE